jgi:hypothetical protein
VFSRFKPPEVRRPRSLPPQTDKLTPERQRASWKSSLTSSQTVASNSPLPSSRIPTLACPSLS